MNNITIAGFEVIPLERIVDNSYNILGIITKSLIQNGFTIIPEYSSPVISFLESNNSDVLVKLLKQVIPESEDELIWLISEHFKFFFIIKTEYDLIFGLASESSIEVKSKYGANLYTIFTTVGGFIYPISIARILIASVLRLDKQQGLAENIDCISNFPIESATSGDIVFTENFKEWDFYIPLMKNDGTVENQETLILLDSEKIIKNPKILIKNEKLLNDIEIASVLPMNLFSLPYLNSIVQNYVSDKRMLSLFNHLSVRAKKGELYSVLKNISNTSIHFNWQFSKKNTEILSESEKSYYAKCQKNKFTFIEKQEESLIYALQILQKRYSNNYKLIEWEVNNLFSNVSKFSPLHLFLKKNITQFLSKKNTSTYFSELLNQCNWTLLKNNGIVDEDEGQKIIELIKIDPPSTLIKMRVIIEKIITRITRRYNPSVPNNRTLAQNLETLKQMNRIPPFIYIFLETLRKSGNIGAHESIGEQKDVEVLLPIFLRVIDWFIETEI